jgi:hypothetical protein
MLLSTSPTRVRRRPSGLNTHDLSAGHSYYYLLLALHQIVHANGDCCSYARAILRYALPVDLHRQEKHNFVAVKHCEQCKVGARSSITSNASSEL